jgi:hypothetical protein
MRPRSAKARQPVSLQMSRRFEFTDAGRAAVHENQHES